MFALGFSDAALRIHEPKAREMIDLFCDKLVEGVPVGEWSEAKNMSRWCKFFLGINLSAGRRR
jgi:hypothetical protein